MRTKVIAGSAALVALTGCQYSVQFHGTGAGRADRIEIPVDPATPIDVGAGDFTLEWWMKSATEDNAGGSLGCGGGQYGWTSGRVIMDRSRDPLSGTDGREFGVAVSADGQLGFGVQNGAGQASTVCTSLSGAGVLDTLWHHVAVQRSSAGLIEIWVDGGLAASATGPTGDISYPDAVAGASATDPYLVVGAEKRDVGLAYAGLIEEVRISTTIRYSSEFTPQTTPFTSDSSTVGLYHLDETGALTGGGTYVVTDVSGATGGPTNGTLRATADGAAPVRGVEDSPFIPEGEL